MKKATILFVWGLLICTPLFCRRRGRLSFYKFHRKGIKVRAICCAEQLREGAGRTANRTGYS